MFARCRPETCIPAAKSDSEANTQAATLSPAERIWPPTLEGREGKNKTKQQQKSQHNECLRGQLALPQANPENKRSTFPGMRCVPELRSPEGLSRAPRAQKAASLDRRPRLCSQSWWPPPKRAAPRATVPAGSANCARLPPLGTDSSAESRTRAGASGARRRPDSDYRFTPGARQARPRAAPLPRQAILLHSCGRPELPPPPPARPPSPSVRIGWRPGRRHFPTARGACGSPAALQARPWHTARPIGARRVGRVGGYCRAGVPGRPSIPARRRPTAARGPQPSSRRADALPPGRGGLQGRGAAGLVCSSRPTAAANPRSEAPIGGSPRLPGSRGPAPAPNLPASSALPLSLGRGAAWERDG